jgi:hypothetical protein
MTVYQVQDDRVMMEVRTSYDLGALLVSAPVDLDELEQDMIELEQESVEIIHRFAPGIYIREALFKAGTIVIGHKHTVPHLNVMLTGRVTLASGGQLTAPVTFVGGLGRKCGVFHEDTVWQNIYATDEQDIGTLENMFMLKSNTAIEQETNRATTITSEVMAARADYSSMIEGLGFSPEELAKQSGAIVKRVELPWGAYCFRTAPSPIHGQGVFASANIKAGDVIGQAHINGGCTVLGYSVNHSGKPNAILVASGGHRSFNLEAISDISGNKGGEFGEEITVDYRESRKAVLCAER